MSEPRKLSGTIIRNCCVGAMKDGATLKDSVPIHSKGAGFSEIIGYLKNFRVVGKMIRGDMHLLLSAIEGPKICELAAKNPDFISLKTDEAGKVWVVQGDATHSLYLHRQ